MTLIVMFGGGCPTSLLVARALADRRGVIVVIDSPHPAPDIWSDNGIQIQTVFDSGDIVDMQSKRGIDLTRQNYLPDPYYDRSELVVDFSCSQFFLSHAVDDRPWVNLNQPSRRPPRHLGKGRSRQT